MLQIEGIKGQERSHNGIVHCPHEIMSSCNLREDGILFIPREKL